MGVCAPASVFMSYATMRAFLNQEYILSLIFGASTISFFELFRTGLNGNAKEDWENFMETNRYILEAIKTLLKR